MLKLSELTFRQGVIEVAKVIYGVQDMARERTFEFNTDSNIDIERDTF